jgi:pyruvate dehydrogenase E2 component (dihydrolipoamide acetyltransferase)
MSTEVVMPQMGESIAEGTITKWLKQVGERVERDEPLFEISTDKVDAEIPSPAAGTLTEIRFKEGETVEINTTVAVLDGGTAGAAPAAPATETAATEAKPLRPKRRVQRYNLPLLRRSRRQEPKPCSRIQHLRPNRTKPQPLKK